MVDNSWTNCGIDENENESYAGSRNGQRSSASTRQEVYPLFEDKKTFKKSKEVEGKNEYFTDVDDPSI